MISDMDAQRTEMEAPKMKQQKNESVKEVHDWSTELWIQ